MIKLIIDKIFSKITSRKKISNIFKKIAIFLKIMLIFRNYTDVGDLIENFEQQIIELMKFFQNYALKKIKINNKSVNKKNI